MKHGYSHHGKSGKANPTKANMIANYRDYGDKSRMYVPQSTPTGDQRQGAGKLLPKKAKVVRGGGSA